MQGKTLEQDDTNLYRLKTEIWDEQRTLIFYISTKLKQGQIRALHLMLNKIEKQLTQLASKLIDPASNKRKTKQILEQINNIVKPKQAENLIVWNLKWKAKGKYQLSFQRNNEEIQKLEQTYGLRIIMTNQHTWFGMEIIQAYFGQSNVEQVFKELKNPYHLTIKPQYHWTDQKIKVHHFICVLAYLLSALVYREVRIKANYKGNINSLLNDLRNIRLASILKNNKNDRSTKVSYKIEGMNLKEKSLFDTLNLQKTLENKVKIKGVSVYN